MYAKDELEIVEYIEEENPKSVENKDEIIAQMRIAVQDKYAKRKAINLKVLESDIRLFKSKAMQEGMGYQTLINSVLHKYITGQLVEKKLVS